MNKNTILVTLLVIITLLLVLPGIVRITSVDAQTEDTTSGLVANKALDSEAGVLASKFVRQVNIIRAVKIDSEIFKDKTFLSLIDWSRPIPEEASGRENPFAPL
jgi:hypothetical protein